MCASRLQKKTIAAATAAGYGDDLNPWKILAAKTKSCLHSLAPNNKPNMTISSLLYKSCGYPGLYQKLQEAKKEAQENKSDQWATGVCNFGCLTLVQLQNYFATKKKVTPEIEEEESKAEADDDASEADVEKEENEITDGDDGLDLGDDGAEGEGGEEEGDDSDLLEDLTEDAAEAAA